MNKFPCKFHLPHKLNLLISTCLSSLVDALYHKSFLAFTKTLSKLKTNLKSNFKNIKDIIMSSKKKKVIVNRPIDAIREMIEDQTLQISDLTEILKKQNEEIRTLKAWRRARESLEEEERLEKEKADSSSWFFASRSSE